MKNILESNPEEFQAWMDGYFKDKSAEDLRNILLKEDSRLAAYFQANPLFSELPEISSNPLIANHLEILLVDRPPGNSFIFNELIEGSSFEPFLFALH